MIPDDLQIFNPHVVPRHFDDHETRLRCRFGQDATPTLDGGRHLLYACPVCKRPWYKAGRREYVRLTSEQLCHLGAILHADISTTHTLPRAICPICSTVLLDGIVTIETCSARRGYRLTWERALPPRPILLAMLCKQDNLPADEFSWPVPALPIVAMREVSPTLSWLEMCPFPASPRPYTDEECRQLALRLYPGQSPDLLSHWWQGYRWMALCPPLGGVAVISLVVASPPGEPAPFARLLTAWKLLARTMRVVL